jgi:hypothetical protein
MPAIPHSDPDWKSQLEPVYRLYAAMARGMDTSHGLGGKLLYAGELHEDGCRLVRRLVRAANIAGAASLSATADPPALRHANRDGVADFLVTTLDEALRILKNEIRKRQTVSVGVSVAPAMIETEMRERGVLPDLLPPDAWGMGENANFAYFLARGARCIELAPLAEEIHFEVWAPAPADFEKLAMAALAEDDHINRRWVRLSPRYLGPAARRVRSAAGPAEMTAKLAEAAGARSEPS